VQQRHRHEPPCAIAGVAAAGVACMRSRNCRAALANLAFVCSSVLIAPGCLQTLARAASSDSWWEPRKTHAACASVVVICVCVVSTRADKRRHDLHATVMTSAAPKGSGSRCTDDAGAPSAPRSSARRATRVGRARACARRCAAAPPSSPRAAPCSAAPHHRLASAVTTSSASPRAAMKRAPQRGRSCCAFFCALVLEVLAWGLAVVGITTSFWLGARARGARCSVSVHTPRTTRTTGARAGAPAPCTRRRRRGAHAWPLALAPHLFPLRRFSAPKTFARAWCTHACACAHARTRARTHAPAQRRPARRCPASRTPACGSPAATTRLAPPPARSCRRRRRRRRRSWPPRFSRASAACRATSAACCAATPVRQAPARVAVR
jgi:hypothetical protein